MEETEGLLRSTPAAAVAARGVRVAMPRVMPAAAAAEQLMTESLAAVQLVETAALTAAARAAIRIAEPLQTEVMDSVPAEAEAAAAAEERSTAVTVVTVITAAVAVVLVPTARHPELPATVVLAAAAVDVHLLAEPLVVMVVLAPVAGPEVLAD